MTFVDIIISPAYNTDRHSINMNISSTMLVIIHDICSDDLRNPITLMS